MPSDRKPDKAYGESFLLQENNKKEIISVLPPDVVSLPEILVILLLRVKVEPIPEPL